MPPPPQPAPASLALRIQRSEQSRAGLFLAMLIAFAVATTIRRFVGGTVMNSPAFWWTMTLLAAGLIYKSWVYITVKRANATATFLGDVRWRLDAALEVAMAFGMLLIVHRLSPLGPAEASSAPPLLVLPLVILLSVLRLRPSLTLWTGLIGAAAHAALVIITHISLDGDPARLPVLLTYSVLLALTAFAGCVVAARVRGYVEAAVSDGLKLSAAHEEMARVDRDLSMARGIQRGLLPQSEPDLPGFEIAGMSRPADHTGGDYYDWQKLADGRLAVVLADVSGHGIAPALVMAVCRAYARASLPLVSDPGMLLHKINELVYDDVHGNRFVTLALAIVDDPGSRINLISAGHGPGFLLRAATGEVEQFDGDGIPLGLLPDETYGPARTLVMAPGDVLLMATDGFFEWRRARDNQQFGIDRLTAVLRQTSQHDAQTILRNIDQAVLDFAEGTPQNDDVTAVIIKRR